MIICLVFNLILLLFDFIIFDMAVHVIILVFSILPLFMELNFLYIAYANYLSPVQPVDQNDPLITNTPTNEQEPLE